MVCVCFHVWVFLCVCMCLGVFIDKATFEISMFSFSILPILIFFVMGITVNMYLYINYHAKIYLFTHNHTKIYIHTGHFCISVFMFCASFTQNHW